MTSNTRDRLRNYQSLRWVNMLVELYAGISVLSLGVVALLHNHPTQASTSVWTHAIIVAASALLTLSFTVRMMRGSGRAFIRLRIVSAVMLCAILVILAIPGSFPLWMKVEQGICGVILAGVVVIVNGRNLRELFASS